MKIFKSKHQAEATTNTQVSKPIASLRWLLYLFLAATLPLLLATLISMSRQSPLQMITYLAFSLALYSLPILLAWNFRALAAIYLLLSPGAWIFLGALYKLGGVPVESLPDIVATTNLRETGEYLSGNGLWPWMLLLAVIAICGVIIVLRIPSAGIPSSWRKTALATMLCATALSLQWEFLPVVGKLIPSPYSDVAAWNAYPLGLISLTETLVARSNTKPDEVAPPFNVVRANTPAEPELHVLIIGESSRWDKWNINGYQRATSPYLSSLQHDELISFSKAHAGANWTYLAVPMILSGIPAEEYHPNKNVRNILGLMKEAGFTTAWMSSQDTSVATNARAPTDFDLELPNTMGEFGHAFERLPYDGELLPVLKNFVDGYTAKRKFVILHVTGSHLQYQRRYPPEFSVFSTAKDGLYAAQPTDRAKTHDEYDNSILYSDWFLGQVIDLARRQPGLVSVTYLSDHGEALYDGPGEYLGHGSSEASEPEQHIPVFMWANPAFRTRYADKWNILQQNRQSPFGQESIFHTLADVLDLNYQGQTKSMSLAQKDYTMRPTAKVMSAGFQLKPGDTKASYNVWLVPVRVF